MRRVRQPRRVGEALRSVRAQAAPATLLAGIQEIWQEVAGSQVAGEATPVAERGGVVTVACRSAVWAQELDLLQGELMPKLRAALHERGADPAALTGMRFTADAARLEPRR